MISHARECAVCQLSFVLLKNVGHVCLSAIDVRLMRRVCRMCLCLRSLLLLRRAALATIP